MGMPIRSSLLRLEKYCTGWTGLISSSSDLIGSNTALICSEVTSMTSSLVFLASNMKQALQTWQSSTLFCVQVHSQGQLKLSIASLTKGIRPIRWHRNSSCSTEVFSMMLTRCGARVGTSEIMILRRALARLTSQPVSANFMVSWVISKIYVVTFYIFTILKWRGQQQCLYLNIDAKQDGVQLLMGQQKYHSYQVCLCIFLLGFFGTRSLSFVEKVRTVLPDWSFKLSFGLTYSLNFTSVPNFDLRSFMQN